MYRSVPPTPLLGPVAPECQSLFVPGLRHVSVDRERAIARRVGPLPVPSRDARPAKLQGNLEIAGPAGLGRSEPLHAFVRVGLET
jgi:hypothetical protein